MEQKPFSMTVANMVSRSAFARRRVAEYLRLAEAMLNDSDSLNRVKANNCVSCYYTAGRIGGSAMTTRPCMCCGLTETYPSTVTDVLCLVCADFLSSSICMLVLCWFKRILLSTGDNNESEICNR